MKYCVVLNPAILYVRHWPRPALRSWYIVSGGSTGQTSVSIFGGSLRVFLECTKSNILGLLS